MSREYAELVDSFEAKKIVCPLPIPWNKLVIFLKSTKQLKMYPVERGPSVHVVNPLILAGWGAADIPIINDYIALTVGSTNDLPVGEPKPNISAGS